ncbi:GtrA family protein [Streptomyces sp. NBC_01136]|uniref:GtrA family protein n=1 Tax=unclassified Streptomyces TaxID=2593676 RepID=UPI003245BC89|nr:GtrA family protein [Streptomyces sp. NBC_01136]
MIEPSHRRPERATPQAEPRPVPGGGTGGQFLRFAVVGVVNTAVYYGLYLVLLVALPYLTAHLLAFGAATVVSFFLNARFTYRTRPTWRKFLRFPLATVTNLVVSTIALNLLVEVCHSGSRTAALLASAVAVPFTFLASRAIMIPGP